MTSSVSDSSISAIACSIGRGGMEQIVLNHISGSSLELYLYGAHVTSWKVAGNECLFMSKEAIFEIGKPIRGGIPLVFPQFGTGKMLAHGFARTSLWRLSKSEVTPDNSVRAVLELYDSEATRAFWPCSFAAQLEVLLSDKLVMTLSVTNRDSKDIEFQNAFHTYFAITDISICTVENLGGLTYLDSTNERSSHLEEHSSVSFSGETDRIYLSAPDVLTISEKGRQRYSIQKIGMKDAVVWNPWIDRCRAIPDLEDDAYLKYVCVETGNVKEPIILKPGSRWECSQTLSK